MKGKGFLEFIAELYDENQAINESKLMSSYIYYCGESSELSIMVETESGNDVVEDYEQSRIIKEAIYNIYGGNRFLFLNSDIILDLKKNSSSKMNLHPILYLDTQAVNYLNRYMDEDTRYLLKEEVIEVLSAIRSSKMEVRLDLYLFENITKMSSEPSRNGVYSDLKGISIFFKENLKDKIPLEERYKSILDMSLDHNSVAWEVKNYHYNAYYAIVLKIVILNKDKHKSKLEKMIEFLTFLNEEIGLVLKREIFLMDCLIDESTSLTRFFKGLNNPQKINVNKVNVIKGIAWDLLHFRILEQRLRIDGYNIEIPYVLSFDQRFNDLFNVFSYKFSIFDADFGKVISVEEKEVLNVLSIKYGENISDAVCRIKENKEKRKNMWEHINVTYLEGLIHKLEQQLV